ncbi:hypothetical protein PR202_gb03686 [Eleusine coracana subsp. coracana]|uniref:Uncharacterized protein n=1 Tax=Eleusine coracana subsp. coracana TaxID=191504 RepID=A0AAV5E2M6_ELECO|nr:hypothetical protein PR202_gb03686 [Eleusine coracana subsp. coracana]
METARLTSFPREQATTRVCMVSSFATELLEMRSKEPSLHVLLIPGKPGIVAVYKDFVEALYENLGGQASITAIGHISHSQKCINTAYVADNCTIYDRMLHMDGSFHCRNKSTIRSSLLSKGVSSCVSLIGSLQASVRRGIVRRLLGPSWSVTAVDAACNHLLRYHTMRNVLFMAMTEFEKLTEQPDWTFIRARQNEIALLFGVDDHWGPLSHLEEVSKRVPGVVLTVETEGHTHSYCCTEAGSFWVADYVANSIKSQNLSRNN